MFIRIQTNRTKLKTVISSFGRNVVDNEILIAPRPLPKAWFKFYVAFASVIDDSRNHKLLESIKNHKQITSTEFETEISTIQYYWKAGGKNALLPNGLNPTLDQAIDLTGGSLTQRIVGSLPPRF